MLSVLPTFLYASTFYRFKYFFSFLKKRQPQIIADVPHRTELQNGLPVLIIVKNSDHYPLRLIRFEIFINQQSALSKTFDLDICSDYWDHIEQLPLNSWDEGNHTVDVKIAYKVKNKTYICYSDNQRGTSHKGFSCYFSSKELPRINNCIHGEMHSHSNFTDDQIEFGASIPATAQMARAIGMDFFCVTDHSYDLDDYPDNFLKNDPELKKWELSRNQIKKYNTHSSKVLIIPGEEVSVRNSKKETVHFSVLNNSDYLPGSGDSGEKWFRYYSELDITGVKQLAEDDAFYFAAHPAEKVPYLHNLLLNRGAWKENDIIQNKIRYLQILNGNGKKESKKAIDFWVQLLLKGYYCLALAGNDAHGSFAKNRSIKIPFIKIVETNTQLFGIWRTDLFLETPEISMEQILSTLREGNYTLSNGPALYFSIFDEDKKEIKMGRKTESAKHFKIEVKTTREFGTVKKVRLIFGSLTRAGESIHFEKSFESFSKEIAVNEAIDFDCSNGYFRAYVKSSGPKGEHVAFSNPIWIA